MANFLFGPQILCLDNGSLSAQSFRAAVSGNKEAAEAEKLDPRYAAFAGRIYFGTLAGLSHKYSAVPIIAKDRFPVRKLNLFPAYKAGRFAGRYENVAITAAAGLQEAPQEAMPTLHQQFRAYLDPIIRSLPLVQSWASGEEADDVIGTMVSTVGRASKAKSVVFTRDTDMLQLLVKPNVKVVLKTGSMQQAMQISQMDAKNFYPVRPDQIVLYKALLGDSGDGIPNIPRMHAKVILRDLIADRTTVQEVYDAWWGETISQKGWFKNWEGLVTEWLGEDEEQKGQAFINEKLARLREDCDVVYEYTGGDYQKFLHYHAELFGANSQQGGVTDALQIWNLASQWAHSILDVLEKDKLPISNPGIE